MIHNLSARLQTLFVLIGLVVLFGIASPHFLTTDNLLNVMQQSAINAILGIGLTFVIISGGIDLSVGSLVAFTGVLSANLLARTDMPPLMVIFICLLCGAALGFAFGLILVPTRIAGAYVAQEMGLTLGAISDPSNPDSWENGEVLVEKPFETQEDGNAKVEFKLEAGIYRIAQEALNNVLKHAQADEVTVYLRAENGIMGLEVADNGRGFDLNTIYLSSGDVQAWGLLGIQERVELANGTFEITTKPGVGTTLEINLPLGSEEAKKENGED